MPSTPPACATVSQPQQPAAWGAVLALALTAFALVASEFMPVSLLTPIATTLSISEGQAGQAIAISGAFALLTSLCIASVAARLDRKVLLVSLALLMIVSGTLVAFAPDYFTFILGRALIGVAIGGFWSLSAATAMRLVPADQVPRALAILNGGNAMATVLAAPLGSLLGALIGWRLAFFAVVPVALAALAWKLFSLPSMKAEHSQRVNVLSLLRRRQVALGMAAASLFFMGQFSLFTYLRPFLERVTGVDASMLSLLLLVLGVAGFIGTAVIGRFLTQDVYRPLALTSVLMAMVAVLLIKLGGSLPLTTVLLGAWGLLGTAAPVAWWTWLARALPNDAEAGGGLLVALVQLAIMLGATVGGLLFDQLGYQATFELSAALLLGSAFVTLLTARADASAHA